LQKQEIKRMGIKNVHVEHERRQLYILLMIAGVLGLILILNRAGILPRFF
jgi:hypothetical protein